MATPHRSLYSYGWDVLDTGASAFIDQLQARNLNGITLASSYHAGKFLRPHSRQGKVIFPEDGVVYFEPDVRQYAELKPQPHSNPGLRRVLDEVLADGRVAVHAWTVLLHNSRLGQLHLSYTTRNAFGDPYLYSLCPSQPAVFDYAVSLCRDLSSQYPQLNSLVLETPGWLPYAHGYHHEFAQLRSNAWLDAQLGLCFCEACHRLGGQAGLDVAGLQQRIAARTDRYLRSPVDASAHQALHWLATDLLEDDTLRRYHQLHQARVTELVQHIRAVLPKSMLLTVIPTVQRPTAHCWTEGSDLPALAQVADRLEVPFYEPNAAQVAADALDLLQRGIPPERIRAILRPGPPDLADGQQLDAAIRALTSLGISEFGFYNHGLLRPHLLDQLGHILTPPTRNLS